MMEYKGFTGVITWLDETHGVFHGEIAGIGDVVTFEAAAGKKLVQAFKDSVDDYLEFCQQLEEAPEKPSSGKLLVRMPKDLHQQAARAAQRAGASLNAWINTAIAAQLRRKAAPKAASSLPD